MSTITRENAGEGGSFSQYRKVATTRISDFTVPPGVTYQTPEGLRAEDEQTRIAFDVQGGVYPIRESVFQASYAHEAAPPPLDGLREAARLVVDRFLDTPAALAGVHVAALAALRAALRDEGQTL